MGCAYSRTFEESPRTFYVWNVDSEGRPVKPGKIEVTDTQLVLYQKENVVVRWPLTSLRRYGFDSQVFSFECGRRCTTGAGVYAFKCRRAEELFTILQECINSTGVANGGSETTDAAEHLNSLSRPLVPGERLNSLHSSTSLPNGNVFNGIAPSSPTVDSAGYLEPITAGTHLHYPGSTTRGAGSPGGYICIHDSGSGVEGLSMADWTPSLPRCCSLGSCGRSGLNQHYVNNEVAEKQHCLNGMCIAHHYMNSAVDVSVHRCNCNNQEQNENTYVNSAMVSLSSPGHHLPLGCCSQCVDFNTNYAKLDDLLKQEQSVAKRHQKEQHYYVNVKPDTARNSGSSGSSKCVSGRSSPTEKSGSLTSHASPGSQHCYANMGSETKAQARMNYAVLDLDQTEVSPAGIIVVSPMSTHNSVHSLAMSPCGVADSYAQIDFDKTVALSNSANPCSAFNDDSMRKTRHNAVIPSTSMTV